MVDLASHGCVLTTLKTSCQASTLLLSKAPARSNQTAAAHTKFVDPGKPTLSPRLCVVASRTTVSSRSSLMSVRRRPELRRTRRERLSTVTRRMVSSWTSSTRLNSKSDDPLLQKPTNEGLEPVNKPLKRSKCWHQFNLALCRLLSHLPLSK